jgi:hypothetical protein
MQRSLLKSRFTLILLGLALGWVARLVLGVPIEETGPSRVIDRPLPPAEEEVIDLPIIRANERQESVEGDQSGLIPPIRLTTQFPSLTEVDGQYQNLPLTSPENFEHGPNAIFEAHGEKVCASGCAASRHPTERLDESNYWRLLREYTYEPMDQTNNALEALLYYGPQTRKWIETKGVGRLDQKRAEFLWEQLQITHARISIRVTDDQGIVRTWNEPTRVPFDRRHIFEMQVNGVQPLVTSGTVKRVGLNHNWVRL